MTLPQAVAIGLGANEVSKKITGSSKVSAGRTAVAVGTGAAGGAIAGGALAVGAVAVGLSAPVTVPLAVAGAFVAGIASLFD